MQPMAVAACKINLVKPDSATIFVSSHPEVFKAKTGCFKTFTLYFVINNSTKLLHVNCKDLRFPWLTANPGLTYADQAGVVSAPNDTLCQNVIKTVHPGWLCF